MIEASSRIERSFHLSVPVEVAWALIDDVPRWGALFPHVESVEPYPEAGPTAFLWRMEPLGPPGVRVRLDYACRYHADAETQTLVWTPVEGVGDARFSGTCVLASHAAGTAGTLRLDAELRVPAPSFLRGVVQPAVAFEMARITDAFLARLDGALAE